MLRIWDGEKIVNYQQNCDIFSFETSKEIAFIHLNHMLNGCFGFCAFENNKETKKSNYIDRWGYMVGELADDYAPIELRLGEYEMKGYLAEQTPIISGDMVFLLGDVEGLPDYPQKTRAIFITIKNLLGFEEEYYFYGTFADIMDMYEITEDMWLDSYDGFTKTENFDLEKAKSLKYCVPIYVADTVEFGHEICLVLDNDKDKNTYILIMDINEETGKKYISGVYQYQWVREHQE